MCASPAACESELSGIPGLVGAHTVREATQASNRQEPAMADKSPRSHSTPKAKSLKEKRADKQAKSAAKTEHTEIIPPRNKR